MNAQEELRIRASYHEAGHAVVAAAVGYNVARTFLTADVTADGRIGGFTGWDNPLGSTKNASRQDILDHVGNVICVLFAGQYAEHHLRLHAPEIGVPEHDANWDNDDADGQRFLGLAKSSGLNMPPEETFRVVARRYVERFWTGVVGLAHQINKSPASNAPLEQAHLETSGGIVTKDLRPASRVLYNGDVRDFVRRVHVAEAAYLHWIDGGRAPGRAVADWRHGEDVVPR